jgi:hypothetical protein
MPKSKYKITGTGGGINHQTPQPAGFETASPPAARFPPAGGAAPRRLDTLSAAPTAPRPERQRVDVRE